MAVYVIDGYNLLHQLIGHRQVDDLEDERRRLIDLVASYMGRTSDRAVIVFDARTQALQKQETATRNVDIYFGSFRRSADSIVEREVYALSAGETVIAVSSDYNLQKTIFRPNVTRLSSRQFAAELQRHTNTIAISRNCITMAHRVEDRIDLETVDKLKALRDELTQEPEVGGRLERGKQQDSRGSRPKG